MKLCIVYVNNILMFSKKLQKEIEEIEKVISVLPKVESFWVLEASVLPKTLWICFLATYILVLGFC